MTVKNLSKIPDVLGKISMRDLVIDPYGTLAAIRESSAAFAVESVGYRMWVITRYDDVRRVLADPSVLRDLVEHRREINAHCMVRPMRKAHLPHDSRRSLFDRDGDDHHRLRALVGGAFTPARLKELGSKVERVAKELVETLPAGEPVDLVSRFAIPLAGTVGLQILGVSAGDRDELAAMSRAMIGSLDIDEIERAAQGLFDYAKRLIAIKKVQPGDDLCTSLLRAHEDGQMSADELASTYILMIIASFEPASSIGSGALALLSHPDQLARLITEPELFPACVEEIVRYESPFRFVPPRYTAAPLQLDGVTIPAGELLLISPAAANRDPARFPSPDEFDMTRQTSGHLGFGHGTHRCLGAGLGRVQTAIALRTLFQRFPHTSLAEPADQAHWQPGKFMRRLADLPVILKD
ncbi:cytochrome P450 [Lentzea sp. NPDC004782]|uniref:cytochrome P450 family protein n=1 Tax=Lentzea sp. NPDC004782 TaxID=3154458 RepID=UPI0033B771E7